MSIKIPKVIADFETSLSGKVSASDTTATLQSATDSDGNALATGVYAFTIDRTNSAKKEHFLCTLTGTALTSIQSIDRRGNLTTGFTRSHRAGAGIILSDHSALVKVAETLRGQLSLDADNPLVYDGEPTLSNREDIATKGYVDDTVNGGEVSYAKLIITGTAGETLVAGNVVYFNTSDQEWYKADADTTYANDTQFGIAQGAGTNGGAITNGILIRGTDTNQSGMTLGATQYISTTAGAITESAPTKDIFVGVAKSATALMVNFENRITDYVNSVDGVTQSDVLESQTTSTNSIAVGEADATTKKNSIAQSFVASKTKMRGVRLYKKADAGSFTGNVVVSLQADSSGSPSGSALATKTITNANWANITDNQEFEVIFTSEYGSLVAEDTYWIVIEPSTADNTNYMNVGADTSGGDGTAYYNNSTDGWVQLSSSYIYYKTLEGNANQVPKTDSTGVLKGVTKAPVVNVYTSTDTWVKPLGLSYVVVEVVGGGGGGGSISGDDSDGGGGGGGYSRETIGASSLNNEETVTVGAGGSAESAGGTSSFGTSAYLQATGGGAGGSGAGGAGGVGSNGDLNITGTDGSPQAGDSAGSQNGGLGGSSVLGGGGAGGTTGAGSAGNNYGGGGGGAGQTSGGSASGGSGAGGVVIVTEFY